MERLLKRRDFLTVQKGRRFSTGLFSMQALGRADDGTARCGFTVSKRVSLKAVVRNRIRRRLKEAVRMGSGASAINATDYVVVARLDCLNASFARLQADLSRAFVKVSPKPETSQTASPSVRP